MPKKQIDYECYRCGYQSNKKSNMKKHLYDLKIKCQGKLNNVELTDEIKDWIMSNRQYTVHSHEGNNGIFSYKVLNNYVTSLDPIEKLNFALHYTEKKQIDFEDWLETQFSNTIKRLEDKSYRAAFLLDESNLLNCLNRATIIESDISQFSFYYDKNIDKIKIYRCNKWESYIKDIGLTELVSLVKSYYFNDYEIYLIKNINDPSSLVKDRFALGKHLEIYYRFIAMFSLTPYVTNLDDSDILGFYIKEENPYLLKTRYTQLYEEQKKTIKASEITGTKMKIVNIIKGNTFQNIVDINKNILDILKVDEDCRREFCSRFEIMRDNKS